MSDLENLLEEKFEFHNNMQIIHSPLYSDLDNDVSTNPNFFDKYPLNCDDYENINYLFNSEHLLYNTLDFSFYNNLLSKNLDFSITNYNLGNQNSYNNSLLSKKMKRDEINTKKIENNIEIEKEDEEKEFFFKNDLNENFENLNNINDLNNKEIKEVLLIEIKEENIENQKEKEKKEKIFENNIKLGLNDKEENKKEKVKKELKFKIEKKVCIDKKKNSFLSLKEKKEKEFKLKIKNNLNNPYPQFGRKSQEEKDKGSNGNHTRESEDNKIRKIKSFFGKNLYLFLKNSLEDELLKLDISINKDLKKEFNEKLFNRTIKDIYMNSKISDKYKHYNPDTNKILINKIYKEKKETSVIKILNLTYREAFAIFIRKIKNNKISPELRKKIQGTNILDNNKFKDIESMINKIKEEEKNTNGAINEYIKDIKRLCINFESWFENKIGRNRNNNDII